jgi:hypothetical protein
VYITLLAAQGTAKATMLRRDSTASSGIRQAKSQRGHYESAGPRADRPEENPQDMAVIDVIYLDWF